MRKRMSLGFQVFLSLLTVSLGTAVVVGVIAHLSLSRSFDSYLQGTRTMMGQSRGMGRMMLGAAEQDFLLNVDQGVAAAGVLAVVAAALIAILLSRYLSNPLRRLERATEDLTQGDLSRRVEIAGPAEVASLGESFNRMADSLETAESLRRRMVADVAHELRNPLAAALAQAEGMIDGVIAVDEARLQSLTEDLEHLGVLVGDLQELAVAESGSMSYSMEPIDVGVLAEREADRVAPLLRHGVAIDVQLPTGPAVVRADERRIGQVIRNLLSNSARYTTAGSVTVVVESGETQVTVSVKDTGTGVSPAELPHIFERFYRADTARAADTGGAGLGLAISKAIISDHNGEMFAASTPGEGTEIGFTLPRSETMAQG